MSARPVPLEEPRPRGRDPLAEPDAKPTPPFFAAFLRLALSALLGFSIVGLPLAMLGVLRPPTAFPMSVVAACALFAAWQRRAPRSDAGHRSPPWWDMAAVLVALGAAAINAKYSSQHVFVDRDPAVYAVTGAWLGNHGRLVVDMESAVFGGAGGLIYGGMGFYPAPEGRLYAQFLHLLPVLLAEANWLGGLWLMLKLNAVLGGLALLTTFAFSRRLMRPPFALAATLALAVGMPFTYFSRGTYSEILALVLLMGGLWALWEARTATSRSLGLVAGLLLGATGMARVDGWLLLIALAFYVLMEVLSAEGLAPSQRSRQRSFAASVAFGLLTTTALGVVDGYGFSRQYVDDLRETRAIGVGLAAVGGGGVLAVMLRHRLPARASVERWVARLAVAVPAVVVLAAAYAWFLRPHIEQAVATDSGFSELVAGLQEQADLRREPNRTYAENTMRWLSWYLGPVALATGVLGTALLSRLGLMRRDVRLAPFLLVFLAAGALYIWRPSISPDHLWAMRRFLPVVIPGLLIACLWLASIVWRQVTRSRFKLPARLGVLLLVGVTIAVPLGHTYPLWRIMRTYVPLAYEYERFCRTMPPGAAVVLVGDEALGLRQAPTLRAVCDTPVVISRRSDPWFLRRLTATVRSHGRQLQVITYEPPRLPRNMVYESRVGLSLPLPELERTLLRRPASMMNTRMLTLYVTGVYPVTRMPADSREDRARYR